MTLFDAPTMPVPVRDRPDVDRRQKLSSIPARCAAAGSKKRQSGDCAAVSYQSHDTTFLRLRSALSARTHRVKTKPVAKDANEACDVRAASHARMSWEISLSRPSHRHCRHRCERPLRMDAPSTGWVTALAGLLARGSLPCWSGLPSFPVADLDAEARRSQLRGQPRIASIQTHSFDSNSCVRTHVMKVSVFPLSSPI